MSVQPEEWWSLLISSGAVKTVLDALTRRAASASPPTGADDQGSRRDVFLNWARLMARLTEHASFCHYLLGDLEGDDCDRGEAACIDLCRPILDGVECCKNSVQLILLHSGELDFVVRLAYALGNIAARCSFARSAILCGRQVLKELCHLCQRQASKVMRKFATTDKALDARLDADLPFDMLCQRLANLFSHTYSFGDAMEQLQQRRLKQDETLNQLVEDLERLTTVAFPSLGSADKDNTVLYYFIKALPASDLSGSLLLQPPDDVQETNYKNKLQELSSDLLMHPRR
ncbi:Armadillo repeat-containing protein 2 [Sparganum proliferum]